MNTEEINIIKKIANKYKGMADSFNDLLSEGFLSWCKAKQQHPDIKNRNYFVKAAKNGMLQYVREVNGKKIENDDYPHSKGASKRGGSIKIMRDTVTFTSIENDDNFSILDVEGKDDSHMMNAQLRIHVDKLPVTERSVIYLYYFLDWTDKELSNLFNVSAQTIRGHRLKILDKLKYGEFSEAQKISIKKPVLKTISGFATKVDEWKNEKLMHELSKLIEGVVKDCPVGESRHKYTHTVIDKILLDIAEGKCKSEVKVAEFLGISRNTVRDRRKAIKDENSSEVQNL